MHRCAHMYMCVNIYALYIPIYMIYIYRQIGIYLYIYIYHKVKPQDMQGTYSKQLQDNDYLQAEGKKKTEKDGQWHFSCLFQRFTF